MFIQDQKTTKKMLTANNLKLLFFPFIFITSGLVLSFVYYAQYVQDYEPCALCIYERFPYWVALSISFFGLFSYFKKFSSTLKLILLLTFLIGLGISFYHIGIEQTWWTNQEICKTNIETDDIEELRRKVLATPVVDCAIVDWTFLGLSMATYNAILSFFLALLSLFSLILGLRKNEK